MQYIYKMLKQVYKNNGVIYIPKDNNMELSFFIINNYEKGKSLNQYKLQFFQLIKKFIY